MKSHVRLPLTRDSPFIIKYSVGEPSFTLFEAGRLSPELYRTRRFCFNGMPPRSFCPAGGALCNLRRLFLSGHLNFLRKVSSQKLLFFLRVRIFGTAFLDHPGPFFLRDSRTAPFFCPLQYFLVSEVRALDLLDFFPF